MSIDGYYGYETVVVVSGWGENQTSAFLVPGVVDGTGSNPNTVEYNNGNITVANSRRITRVYGYR